MYARDMFECCSFLVAHADVFKDTRGIVGESPGPRTLVSCSPFNKSTQHIV